MRFRHDFFATFIALIGSLSARHFAKLTGSLCIVFVEMLGQITFLYKLSTTLVTVEGFFSMMYFEMPGQMTFLKTLFVTLVAIWCAMICSRMGF